MRAVFSCILLCATGLLAADAARSQVLGQIPARPEAAPSSQTCSPAGAKVVDAYKALAPADEAAKGAQPPAPRDHAVQLGDTIAVQVKPDDALASEACRKKPVVLFLNGVALKGVTGQPPVGSQPGVWKFALSITDDSREAWSALLGRPDFGRRKLTASLGFEDQPPLGGDPAPILEMKILPTIWLAIWGGIFLLMLAVFLCCAKHTNIIRGGAAEGDAPAGAQPAYSLSKSQAALWFFIILASYLLIGMVTGDFSNSLNGTALMLLGIGGGTVLGAAVIDTSKATPEQQQQKKQQAQQAQQTFEQLSAAIAKTQAAQTVPAQAAQIPRSIATLPAQREAAAAEKAKWTKLSGQSSHFLNDILSDANGVNFHRFQLAVWTLVLSIIFIKDVYLTLAMPTFNATLMGLLGLSAGTYLGLKIPEPPK
ncbi:MAG: hypothetical protein QOF14_5483 [Hyphomicrobiales bacterium]|nr:hypothetical protein [Hyphomicrobiales bacterium]